MLKYKHRYWIILFLSLMMLRSYQTFRPVEVLPVKLLGIMLRNRCWPTFTLSQPEMLMDGARSGRCDQPFRCIGTRLDVEFLDAYDSLFRSTHQSALGHQYLPPHHDNRKIRTSLKLKASIPASQSICDPSFLQQGCSN